MKSRLDGRAMRLNTTLPLVAALLAPTAAAQMSFDYITFDRLLQDTAVGGSAFHGTQGIIVNTGTVPIDLTPQWSKGGLVFAQVHGPLDPTQIFLNPNASPAPVLMPGEATGSDDPLYTSLLLPGETFIPGFQTHVMQFETAPALSTTRLDTCILMGSQVVRLIQEIQIGDGSTNSFTHLSAKRFSSQPSVALFEHWGESCPLPTGPLTILPVPGGDASGTNVVGNASNMPVIGNPTFRLTTKGITEAEVGAPWLMMVSSAQQHVDVSGCWLFLDLFTPPLLLGDGVIQLVGPDGYQVPTAPSLFLPIPDQPVLVGAEFWAQTLLVSANAPNGTFVLSDAVHFAIGECP